jgi:hypothetical protein
MTWDDYQMDTSGRQPALNPTADRVLRYTGPCAACGVDGPISSSTGDCACLVCEACANDCMERYQCGVCREHFPKDGEGYA